MIDIKGFDLRTDGAIQETCRVANESTGLTRSVLYAIVFTSVLSIIALWNSRQESWLNLRIKYISDQKALAIDSLLDSARTVAMIKCQFVDDTCCRETMAMAKFEHGYKKLRYRIIDLQMQLDKLLKVEAENSTRFHIPVFGTSTDVNDLGITAGMALSILMFILLFTLGREYNNLKIAFLSITERYADDCDTKYFKEQFDEISLRDKPVEFTEVSQIEQYNEKLTSFIKAINYTRRKHHYNYLSMNEIFTLPTLSNNYKPSAIRKLSTYVIWLSPLIAQATIFLFDLQTRKAGMDLNSDATIRALILDAVFLVFISFTTYACVRKKFEFSLLWDNFYINQYKLCNNSESY